MDPSEYLDLFGKVGGLKRTVRAGWLRKGIPAPESVADHSHRAAFMGMVLGDLLGLDSCRITKMLLIHDMAEAVAGDITPFDGVTAAEKRSIEERAARGMLNGVPGGEKYLELWLEYEEGKTPEAGAARWIDKLEMALQAVEYSKEHPRKDMSEFMSGPGDAGEYGYFRDMLEKIRGMM